MSKKLLVLPVAVLVLAAALLADGPSEKDRAEFQKRLAALNTELATAHQELAVWCEKQGLLRQALRHWKEAQSLLTSSTDSITERVKKVEDDLAQNPPEPGDAVKKAYVQKLEELSKAFTKKFEELARWANQKNLKDESVAMTGRSRAFDPEVMIAGEKGTSRLELASWQKEIGNQVCSFRKIAGCAPVEVDMELSAGAEAHALYLYVNEGSSKLAGMGVHEEQKDMPGYTDAGAKCAASCDIAWGHAEQAVDSWMGTFYHRIPLLATRLAKVGLGKKDGVKDGTVLVADLQSGMNPNRPDEPVVVLFPTPNQDGVPHAFTGEMPDPIPGGTKGTEGYPVTLTAYDDATHAIGGVAVARLLGPDGKEVPCWASTPQSPARADFGQRNTIGLIPKAALSGRTKYTVEIKCEVGGAAFEKTWSFTTK